MPKKLPQFRSEAEEARWYAEHDDVSGAYFEPMEEAEIEALKGLLPPKADSLAKARTLGDRHKPRTKPTSIRLPEEDVEAAKRIAARKGLGYQTWLKMVLHTAIADENAGLPDRKRTNLVP